MKSATYRTMRDAFQGLNERGFTSSFRYLDRALQDAESGRTFTAQEVTIVEHHRFEGASDPDEMSVVYAIDCQDGTRGILVDAFGVYANPQLGEFLKTVKVRETL